MDNLTDAGIGICETNAWPPTVRGGSCECERGVAGPSAGVPGADSCKVVVEDVDAAPPCSTGGVTGEGENELSVYHVASLKLSGEETTCTTSTSSGSKNHTSH